AVVTIEPGIYIPDEAIGVRIEDDVLVTKDGTKNLSAKIPKTVTAIEKVMGGRSA
ncbi:MAG: M24 family metallopeptidase, partial [Planctomycetota bacterium]